MDLKSILTISGEPDLFKMITSTAKGIVIESIITHNRKQAFASQRVNSLDDITVFTQENEITLKEVFVKMYKYLGGKNSLSHKSSPEEIKKFFADFFPDYDRERVKLSAMKRILKWYNVLNEAGLIDDKLDDDKLNDDKLDDDKLDDKSTESEETNTEANTSVSEDAASSLEDSEQQE